jgi:hypothetical protein
MSETDEQIAAVLLRNGMPERLVAAGVRIYRELDGIDPAARAEVLMHLIETARRPRPPALRVVRPEEVWPCH